MQITEAPKNCNPNEIFQLNFIHSNLALELNDVGRWTINVGFVCNAPAAVNAWLTYRRFIFFLLDSQVCPLSCLFWYWFMPNALLFHYSLAHLPAPLRCSPISFTCSHSRNVLIVSHQLSIVHLLSWTNRKSDVSRHFVAERLFRSNCNQLNLDRALKELSNDIHINEIRFRNKRIIANLLAHPSTNPIF